MILVMERVIEVERLAKKFGNFTAVDHISFYVERGEIFGFLGANGAGKTTAMRMLCGLSKPTFGTGRVVGFDILRESEKIKSRIGYMSQKFSLYESLTVKENIRLYGGIYGMRRSEILNKMDDVLAYLGLLSERNTLVRLLPQGVKQRLAFSVATFHKPQIVFLDEPTGGVDPAVRRMFWELIYQAAAEGITVFVTTHYMDEAEYCDRVSIMVDGRIQALASPSALKQSYEVPGMQEFFIYWLGKPKERSDGMKLKTFIDQFLAFTRKEFFHILRDRKTLLVLVVLPISQLLIFGFALNSSLTEMPTAVLDMSNDRMSRQIVSEIDASSTFKIVEYVSSMQEVDELFKSGKLSLVLVFMPGFEREIKRTGKGNMQVIMDASLQINASTLESYILATLLTYQQKINAGRELPIQIIPEVKMRYNPRLNSAFHFVPGVIGIVLMLVCSMMASLAIVKEKESGTMEVLLVSPVRPPVIILAKLMPYLLIGMINIVVILLISVFVLKVPVAGNIFLLFFVGTIFTLSSLALGIMVSVLTKTQRSAIIISIAGLMLPAITLSGFIFPLDSLSMGMKVIVHAMPVTLFISSA